LECDETDLDVGIRGIGIFLYFIFKDKSGKGAKFKDMLEIQGHSRTNFFPRISRTSGRPVI